MGDRALLSRTAGVSVAVLAVITAVLGTPGVAQRIRQPCLEQICEPFERPTGPTLRLLDALGISVSSYAAAFTVASWLLLAVAGAVALVLVWRRPSVLAVVTGFVLVDLFLAPFVDALAEPDGAAAAFSVARAATDKVCLVVLMGLFPDGRWHPAWLRRTWPVLAVLTAGPIITNAAFGWPHPESMLGVLSDAGLFVVFIGFQLHRYLRVSDWTARAQTKWMLLGFLLLAANLIASFVLDVAGVLGQWQLGLVLVAYAAFMLFVFGVAFAILRYRLYDVNLVLRRTALYSAAVILLFAVYVGLVAVASLSMARGSASILGAAAVAALALALGVLATRAGGWLRARIFGARSRPGGVAAALVRGITADEGAAVDVNLAETIATALGVPHAAVLDRDGRTLWEYGDPTGRPHRESIVDVSGGELGALLLTPSRGNRLDRQERRALREVRPFVVLVLRARDEAEEARLARATAATAREDERRRLRRDLHDGVGPLLAGQLLTLDTLRLASEQGLTSAQLLAHLEAQARSAIAEVRRISRDLTPAALTTGGGLRQALIDETDRLRAAGLPVDLDADLDGRALPPAVEVATLRIVQESLANVVRHATAGRATVRITADDTMIEVTVTDDGAGRSATAKPGVGTQSMRERARELGGTLDIGPGPDGTGTRVHGRIPL